MVSVALTDLVMVSVALTELGHGECGTDRARAW